MDYSSRIRIALPSKGRLEGETLDFLAHSGLRVDKTNPRQYSARIPSLPGVLALFQRARDIPKSVAAGDVDLGITGYDAALDALGDDPDEVITVHEALGYGNCELVLAVPKSWDTVDDLVGLAAQARDRGGLRVATKHVNATRRFFETRGIEGIRVVSADGALEAAPTIGYADLIADITSTGTTLSENSLKPLKDGTIARSEAVLICNRHALESRDEVLATTSCLLEFIEAHLRARGQYLVFANMRGATADEVARRMVEQTDLGGLQGPTISPVIAPSQNGGWWAVNIVVPSDHLYSAVQQLRSVGGSGVVVTPATYIFEERPARYQRLLAALGKEEAAYE
jgi:ATP phosphoribosyltransferase